jgi:hypothetical protein
MPCICRKEQAPWDIHADRRTCASRSTIGQYVLDNGAGDVSTDEAMKLLDLAEVGARAAANNTRNYRSSAAVAGAVMAASDG